MLSNFFQICSQTCWLASVADIFFLTRKFIAVSVLASNGHFANDLRKIDKRVLTKFRTRLLTVFRALLLSPFIEPRQTTRLCKLVEMFFSVSVADFFDLIERSES